jgi:hypothetical protein
MLYDIYVVLDYVYTTTEASTGAAPICVNESGMQVHFYVHPTVTTLLMTVIYYIYYNIDNDKTMSLLHNFRLEIALGQTFWLISGLFNEKATYNWLSSNVNAISGKLIILTYFTLFPS